MRARCDARGVTIHDDWDALGMRASGSNSVSFDGVELPEAALRGGFPAGDAVAYMERNLSAGLFHASASLGIAEVRRDTGARPRSRKRGRTAQARTACSPPRAPWTSALARATLARAATLIDEHEAANPAPDGDAEELTAMFTEAQAVKAFINEAAAVRVVDRALALSGGAGYRNGHPLARAYRDVRAGAFMNPLAAEPRLRAGRDDRARARPLAELMRAPLIVGRSSSEDARSDGSATERVLRASLDAAGALGARTRLLAGTALGLPMYAPGPRATGARGLWSRRSARPTASSSPAPPTTARSVGLVKNALDHAEDLRHADRPYLEGRAVGCIAVAGGSQAGAATLATLRAIGHALRGWPTPLGVAVDTSDRVFDAEGAIDDAVVLGQLDLLADQVVGFARGDRRMLAPQSPPVRSGHSRLRTA